MTGVLGWGHRDLLVSTWNNPFYFNKGSVLSASLWRMWHTAWKLSQTHKPWESLSACCKDPARRLENWGPLSCLQGQQQIHTWSDFSASMSFISSIGWCFLNTPDHQGPTDVPRSYALGLWSSTKLSRRTSRAEDRRSSSGSNVGNCCRGPRKRGAGRPCVFRIMWALNSASSKAKGGTPHISSWAWIRCGESLIPISIP